MQLGVGKTVFPAWAASLTLVKDHGQSAVGYAAAAVKAGDGSTRLDAAVRAMTSFDHAIDNTAKLPASWFVRRAGLYLRGYEAAKQAVTLLVASGIVPGARERVGRGSLNSAKDTFLSGVAVARADGSRYGAHLAGGWLEATAEDALAGARMLRPDGETTRALLSGVAQVRTSVARRKGVDGALVDAVTQLFDRAGAELDARIAASSSTRTAGDGEAARVMEQSGRLLAEAEFAARALVADAPAESVFDQLPAAG